MDEVSSPVNIIVDVTASVRDWSNSVASQNLVVVIVAIAVVLVLRRWLAKLVVKLATSVVRHLNADIGEDVQLKMVEATEMLLVALVCYIGLEVLNPPEVAGGVLRRLIISVAVIAVFSAWYRLAGTFVAVLREDTLEDIRIEKDWMVRVAKFAIMLLGISALLEV